MAEDREQPRDAREGCRRRTAKQLGSVHDHTQYDVALMMDTLTGTEYLAMAVDAAHRHLDAAGDTAHEES